jgi:hypothetical protein
VLIVNLNRKGADGKNWVRHGAQTVPDHHSLVMFKLRAPPHP